MTLNLILRGNVKVKMITTFKALETRIVEEERNTRLM